MKQICRNWPVLFLAITVAALAIGCGGDDDKGTNVPNMSPQEQAALVESMLGTDMATFGAELVPFAMIAVEGSFFDGITEEDFSDFDLGGFGFTGIRLFGFDNMVEAQVQGQAAAASLDNRFERMIASLAQDADADTELITVIYDDAKGWWFVTALLSIEEVTEEGAISMTLTLSDSLRFEDASGEAMRDPIEGTTDAFLHGYDLDLDLGLVSTEVGFEADVGLGLDIAGNADVTGLTLATVTMNGNTAMSAEADAHIVVDNPDYEPVNLLVDGAIGLQAALNGFQFPTPTNPDVDPCPTAGSMTAGFSIDLDVTQNTEVARAQGSWDMTAAIVGPGVVNVDVYSGNFHVEAENVPICMPSL